MWTQSQTMELFSAQPYVSMSRMPGFILAMLLSSSHLSLLMNQQWLVSKKSLTKSPKPGLSRKDDPEHSNFSFLYQDLRETETDLQTSSGPFNLQIIKAPTLAGGEDSLKVIEVGDYQ